MEKMIPAFSKLDVLNFKTRQAGWHDNSLIDYLALDLKPCHLRNYSDAAKQWYDALPFGASYIFGLLASLYTRGYGEYFIDIADLKRWLLRHTVCLNLSQHRSTGVIKSFPINVKPCSKQVCHFDSKKYFNRADIVSAKIETLLKLMLEM